MAFNPSGVNKHELTYTSLSCVHTKKNLYLLAPLIISNFCVNACVVEERNRLNSIEKWNLLVPRLNTMCCSYIIIQSINIISLQKHYLDYKSDYNMKSAHILCF